MQSSEIYQFHAWLCGISPLIWRRLLVRSDQTALSRCAEERLPGFNICLMSRKYGWLIQLVSGDLRCDDLLPCLQSTLPFHLVVHSRKEMPFRSEVSCHNIVHLEKTLRMLRRFEALHPALSLPGWLMRVLRSIVEVPALPMSDSRQNYFLGCTVATEFICDDYTRPTSTALQQLSEEPHCSKTIPLGLHQNVNDCALLIDCSPKIMLHAVDLQEDFVEKPFVAQLGPSPLQFGC